MPGSWYGDINSKKVEWACSRLTFVRVVPGTQHRPLRPLKMVTRPLKTYNRSGIGVDKSAAKREAVASWAAPADLLGLREELIRRGKMRRGSAQRHQNGILLLGRLF